MLAQGIIEEIRSPWHNHIVVVLKPDDSIRLCIDFRKMNTVSVFHAFPMPNIDETIEKIGNAKFMSTLDITKRYWQILTVKADRVKMAFGTPWGIYQFTRMPFGLHGAATSFQHLMDCLLAPHQVYAVEYIDDIIIFSNDWEQHARYLEAVFRELKGTGLRAYLGKYLCKEENQVPGVSGRAREGAASGRQGGSHSYV